VANDIGLTDAKIAGIRPPASGQQEYPDRLIAGLRLRVGSTGAKTFILRKRVAGKLKNITLGRYSPRFGLAAARRKARDLLVDIEAGKDPSAAIVRRSVGAQTVRKMVDSYLAAEVRDKKRSAREIERILTGYVVPAIGDRLADSITRADVTQLIDDVVNTDPKRPKRSMGRAVFAQLSAFYSWAMPRLDRLPANPCRDAGRPAPAKSRERVLSDDEIRAFWKACGKLERPFGPAFKLLLLTGQRRSEVFEATWAEFEGETWTIPAERAKNGVAHLVPLPKAAQDIIGELPTVGGTPFLFPSRGNPETAASGFSKAMTRLCREMATELEVEAVAAFVLHDLRRTMATGMQRLGVALPVVEAVLNHVSGSRAGVAGVYQRHDYLAEKQHALKVWAAEIARIVASKPGAKRATNITPFSRSARRGRP
jgi:integrase